MRMLKLKRLIIILGFSSIILLIIIVGLYKYNESQDEKLILEQEIEKEKNLVGEEVDNIFIDTSVKKNDSWNLYLTIQEKMNLLLMEDLCEDFYNCINEKYVNDNNITIDYVKEINGSKDNNIFKNFLIEESYIQEKLTDKIFIYVKGKIQYKNNQRDFYFAYETDYTFFDITPLTYQEYESIIKNEIEYPEHELRESDYTIVDETVPDDDYICEAYFNNYMLSLQSNIKSIYEKLSNNLKNDKFQNYKDFEVYINENFKNYSDMYIYEAEKDGFEVIITDNLGNKFVLEEKAVLDYEIKEIDKVKVNI